MQEWAAELVMDAALVRRLLASRFPDLVVRTLRPLAEGWDNAVWLVDGEWAFRFPRREIAVPGVVREMTVLPQLAAMLPLAVPTPVHLGAPGDDYPWPFFGAHLIHGEELPDAAIPDDRRAAVAEAVGTFLRALHAPPVAERFGADLRVDPLGRADMGRLVPRVRERLDEVERLGAWKAGCGVDELLETALALEPSATVALVHGDLHVRHLLVGDTGAAGVIDWGDMCLADPSVDLQIGWSAFSGSARSAFLDAYGPVPDGRAVRAQVLALHLSALLVIYAQHEGLAAVEREALGGLTRAVT